MPAQTPQAPAPDVQAVYLFDFAKFVRWPAGSEGPLRFCIAGPLAFADALRKIVSEGTIEGHPLEVTRVAQPSETEGCSVLYIDDSEKDHLDAFLAAVDAKPALTVSDLPDFMAHGGMIQFVPLAKRMRFSVNLDPVKRSGLSLSSELLKVAVAVMGNTSGGAP
ncbi:MAG TPA: YfiR family protein [Acidobacteriaceae bacterium]|nr:YfiR family protein [Acidobacteriaceae bacterium]